MADPAEDLLYGLRIRHFLQTFHENIHIAALTLRLLLPVGDDNALYQFIPEFLPHREYGFMLLIQL